MLKPVSDPSPNIGIPRAHESINIYTNENAPPKKSSNTFVKLHPLVDLRLKFKTTYGAYLTRVTNALL